MAFSFPKVSFKFLVGGALVLLAAAIAAAQLFKPQPTYRFASVVFPKKGNIVQVWVPTNSTASELGLAGKDVLPEDYGMLWRLEVPEYPSFWMKDMRIPLDFIWIRDGKVVEITPNVSAQSGQIYTPKTPVTDILEVNAGFAAKQEIKEGDLVEILDAAN